MTPSPGPLAAPRKASDATSYSTMCSNACFCVTYPLATSGREAYRGPGICQRFYGLHALWPSPRGHVCQDAFALCTNLLRSAGRRRDWWLCSSIRGRVGGSWVTPRVAVQRNGAPLHSYIGFAPSLRMNSRS